MLLEETRIVSVDDHVIEQPRVRLARPSACGCPAHPSSCLECRDVTVRFGGVVAVDSVSLAVPPASIVGLAGPDGAGQRTLFSVLSGRQRPSAGTVEFKGRNITGTGEQYRARLGLASTFQHREVFSGLTVREHVALAYRVGTRRARIWSDMVAAPGLRPVEHDEVERVGSLLDALRLSHVAEQPVTALSPGLARLVEVARALAVNPAVLLLDEPSSGLDEQEAARVAEGLRLAVDRRGVSLLVVEHDLSMALGLCDYVNVLDSGVQIASGTPGEIRADPAVRAAYLGARVPVTEYEAVS